MSDSAQKMIIINEEVIKKFASGIMLEPGSDKERIEASQLVVKGLLDSPQTSLLSAMKAFRDAENTKGCMGNFFCGIAVGIGLVLCSNDNKFIELTRDKFNEDGTMNLTKDEIAKVKDEMAKVRSKREFAEMRAMGSKQ